MRNTNKKGFTIVELVIVVAVIAILAAVLIPTFAGIIDKANESADIQAARQLNTQLALFVGDEKPTNINELIAALEKEDIDINNYKPLAKGAKFYWVASLNCIVYENAEGEIIFPEGIGAISEADKFALAVSIKNNADFQNAIAEGGVVSVEGEMTVDTKSEIGAETYAGIYLIAEKDTVLNGGDIYVEYDITGVKYGYAMNISLSKDADVQVNDMKVSMGNLIAPGNAMSQQYAFHSRIYSGNTLTLNNVDVDNSGGVAVALFGEKAGHTAGKAVLNNVTAIQSGGNSYATTALATGQGITVEINGGKYQGAGHALYMYDSCSNITINSGEFIGNVRIDATNHNKYAEQIPADNYNTLTINGGDFTQATFNVRGVKGTSADLIINGGTFSIDPTTIAQVTVNGTVTDNGNGTWTVK